MKSTARSLSILLILSFLLLSACSARPASLLGQTGNNPAVQVQATSTPSPATEPLSGNQELVRAYESVLENIYTTVNPSVVNIRVIQTVTLPGGLQQLPGSPFGFPGFSIPQVPQVQQGLGSGFVWDQQGDIVTNNHVVDGADKIEVTFSDGTTVPASVIGTDPNSDLAVAKVDVPAEKLHPVQMGDSSEVKVGQLVIAIGNPFGLQGTMTVGIVSAVGRSLPVGEGAQTGGTYSIPDIIQTDAPINPGNSGGVLVDDQGQVVGVTAAIESPVQANAGIGFVIPSAIVQRVVPVLIKSGHYDHPYLGISGLTLTPDLAQAMNLDPDQQGALVEEVVPGGPADQAGLRGSNRQVTINGEDILVGGDVITAIDGQPIKSMVDLISYLSNHTQVGQKVTLTILRGGKELSIKVTLKARPSSQPNLTTSSQPGVGTGARLGILGITLTPELDQTMNLPQDQSGILVEQVEVGSPADQAGLRGSFKPITLNGQSILVGGDIIVAVDGQEMTSLGDLQAFLQAAQPGEQVKLTILREGEKQEVPVTLAGPSGQLP